MQGTMPCARGRWRPRTAWMDNIKTWTGLPMEESIKITEDRDKWRKCVHGVADPRIEDGSRTQQWMHHWLFVRWAIDWLTDCISLCCGCCKWRKMIKDVRWSGWVWVGECFFWYRLTRVVPDKRPLNGCVCVCVCVVAVEQSNQLIVVDESSELVTGIVTQSDILQYLISLKCWTSPSQGAYQHCVVGTARLVCGVGSMKWLSVRLSVCPRALATLRHEEAIASSLCDRWYYM